MTEVQKVSFKLLGFFLDFETNFNLFKDETKFKNLMSAVQKCEEFISR